jgi:preprotein translocase subunit SecG
MPQVGSVFFMSRLPALLFILFYVLLMTVYYIAKARHQQRFSKDEMLTMVAVYSERGQSCNHI